VYAVDVGKGQLHWKLRQDPRVRILEGINARYLEPEPFDAPVDLATIDVSFISLRLVVPAVLAAAAPRAWVMLVKPQFEVGREHVERGGLVTDPDKHRRVLRDMLEMAAGAGLAPAGLIPSPVRGAKGNREFLLHLRPDRTPPPAPEQERWIVEATQ
jgi:23S rRNA (cytidine1920-2'-O)/16S rRNA (cytidine1409-2'-O)-methyltransferase